MLKSVKYIFILIQKSVIVFIATTVVSNAIFAESEYRAIKKAREDANKKGYGKSLSSTCNTFTLYNMSEVTYEVRSKPQDGDWTKDTKLYNGKELSFPMPATTVISINGDGSSDDIKLNDEKGYIEYKMNELNMGLANRNNWENLITWNGKEWQLNTISDKVKKRSITLLPAVEKKECSVTLVKDNDLGRSITQDFNILRLVSDTQLAKPLRVKIDNQWQKDDTLKKNQQRDFDINKVEQISLNGDTFCDDIKINNTKGYIEFQVDVFVEVEHLDVNNKFLWITHAWWNPKMRKWYGTQSKTWINGVKSHILKASFDESKGIVIFTIK